MTHKTPKGDHAANVDGQALWVAHRPTLNELDSLALPHKDQHST